jgi:Protein of unknown function (DUF3995)
MAPSTVAVSTKRSPLIWSGYAAFAWGLVFAAISFYWGLGGDLGLDTLGGTLERLGRARDPAIIAAVWVTGVLKLGGAVLALALVQPWGRRLPRPLLLVLGWGVAAVLTLYGGTLVASEAMVVIGLARPAQVDWKPLLWHLYLWDMSFLVWGILFALGAWHATRYSPSRRGWHDRSRSATAWDSRRDLPRTLS